MAVFCAATWCVAVVCVILQGLVFCHPAAMAALLSILVLSWRLATAISTEYKWIIYIYIYM